MGVSKRRNINADLLKKEVPAPNSYDPIDPKKDCSPNWK
jgi:hypothetical protein